MDKIIYRIANLADLEQLVPLRVLMQSEVNGLKVSDVPLAYHDSVRNELLNLLSSDSFFAAVAESHQQLIAMNALITYKKLPSIRGGGSGRIGYISSVYTRPEWRQKGIATELMHLVIKKSQELGLESLNLGTTELGKGVYERIGFKPAKYLALELKL